MKFLRMIAIVISILLIIIFPTISSSKCISSSVILVTGFEPFNNYEINPSQLIVEEINGQKIGNMSIIGIVLPVDFDEAINISIEAIEVYNPVLIISTGLAGYARCIRIENIGLNLKCSFNNGKREYSKINPYGPLIYFSSLPTLKIVTEIRNEGIPARLSFFAGTYVCNAVMYSILHYINVNNLSIKAGFIHLPPLATQTPYGMELNKMIDAIKIAIESSLDS